MEIREKEKRIIKNFLRYTYKNKIDDKNQDAEKIIKETITRLFELSMEDIGAEYRTGRDNSENDILMRIIKDDKFLANGAFESGKQVSEDGEIIKDKPEIRYNIYYLCELLKSDDEQVRLFASKKYIITIFHEIQHYVQHLMTELEINSNDSIRFARDFALTEYLDDDFYEVQNYESFTIENNANIIAYKKYRKILEKEDPIMEFLKDTSEGMQNNGTYEVETKSKFGNKKYYIKDKEKDDAADELLDKLICEEGRIDILEMYPILKKVYNSNGVKKNFIELIVNMEEDRKNIESNNDIHENKKQIFQKKSEQMYFELIYNALGKATEQEIRIFMENTSEEERINLFSRMKNYYKKEEDKILSKVFIMHDAKTNLKEEDNDILINYGEELEKIEESEDEKNSKKPKRKINKYSRVYGDVTQVRLKKYYDTKIGNLSKIIKAMRTKKKGNNISLDDIEKINEDVRYSEIISVIREIESLKDKDKNKDKGNKNHKSIFIEAD